MRPVWIVLLLLVPCLVLTVYYSQYTMPGSGDSDSLVPGTGYAFVLLLVNLDLIGLVVLTLLLSRSLIKAYFERRHHMMGSGFRAKLVAAFIGFSLIPTVLLAFVASGLVNKAVDVWFSEQIEQVLNDSYEVARMHHAGHIALAINSARAISHEIFREDLMTSEQRDLLLAAMARKRAEHHVAGVEVFSSKMETLTKALDPEVPAMVLDLPIGQLVLQVLSGKQELTSVQEAQNEARRRSHNEVDTWHLLVALLAQEGGIVPSLVEKLGLTVSALQLAADCRGVERMLDRLSKALLGHRAVHCGEPPCSIVIDGRDVVMEGGLS